MKPEPVHSPFDTTSPERYQASRRVALLSMSTNAVLVVGQIVVGVLGHSQALVADGLHTLSDMAADILVLFALKHGAKAADEDHPYGHARIETAVTVALGSILVMVGVFIAVRAVLRLMDGEAYIPPSSITLWVAGATILAKEALYQYTIRTARRFGSDLLRASAWHHRSDAISSIIVFAGIAGSIAGIAYMDALAALGVALFVAKIGIELGWPAINQLVDRGLDEEALQHIRRSILAVDGVQALHLLRTRRMGSQALVDVHILVGPKLSVSEGHHISEAVRARLLEAVDEVSDVVVHIDPEDDEQAAPNVHLPLRSDVIRGIKQRIGVADAKNIRDITLHYLDGKLHIELLLGLHEMGDLATAQETANRLTRIVQTDTMIADVQVRFQ